MENFAPIQCNVLQKFVLNDKICKDFSITFYKKFKLELEQYLFHTTLELSLEELEEIKEREEIPEKYLNYAIDFMNDNKINDNEKKQNNRCYCFI